MALAFFVLFSWFMVKARTQRQVMALCMAGTVAAALVAPPRVQAQGDLVAAIQAVLDAINGVIQTALNSINTVRTTMSNLYQNVVWPVNLINQAQTQVTQMMTQYQNLMQGIFNVKLASATLPVTQQLETLMRNQQTNDFSAVTTGYANAYGLIPAATAANPQDRLLTDMDDALAMDNLKTLKAADAAASLTVQAAAQMESAASQAAPGSAPFLTASAVVASIQSQAITQKMLAAELRQEAASMAHQNAERKRMATNTGQFGNQIMNLLKRN